MEFINTDESEWSLAEAALLIANVEYPDLEIRQYLQRLEHLADTVAERAQAFSSALERVTELNLFLFEDQGFGGNADNYYDTRNSFLNQVLDRRLGIPVTLSILYMEVGKRLSLGLQGVSFPGRFLVKFAHAQGEIVLDPFTGGVSLGLAELETLLKSSFGKAHGQLPPLDQLLAAASKKDILLRLLRNLKSIYLHTSQIPKALSMLDLMLLIDPGLVDEWRERGELYQRLECFRPALQDYQHYLEMAAGSARSDEVRRRISELSQRVLLLH
jgi:regulator of sirC expression with transglutaminase-like and TPR domain